MPIPPGNRGAFAHVASPGSGAFAIYRGPRPGTVDCEPRGDSWSFDPRVLQVLWMKKEGKDEAFVENWLVRQGLKNLEDVS